MPGRPSESRWIAAGLVVLAALAWGANLGDAFLSDDFARLHEAQRTPTPWHALRLHPEAGERMFVRPLLFLGFWLNQRFSGGDPLGYHLVNLAFHALNAWLLVRLVSGAAPAQRAAAWIAGAAFAVFPLHAEAVVWISGRVDVLCATGVLASLAAWQRFLAGERRWPLAACAWFVAALSFKEMALTVPLLAFVLAWEPGRRPQRRVVVGCAALGVVAVLYLGARFALLGGLGGYGPEFHTQLSAGSVARHALRAAQFLLVPTHRALHPEPSDLVRLATVLALLFALVLAFARGVRARSSGVWRWLVLCGVALLPVLGWAELADDNRMTRVLYLPSAFFCAGLGQLFAAAASSRRRLASVALGLLFTGYLVGAWRAARVWHAASESMRADLASIEQACAGRESVELVVTGFPAHRDGAHYWSADLRKSAWTPTGVARVTVLAEPEWTRRLQLGASRLDSGPIFLRHAGELGVQRALSAGPRELPVNARGFHEDAETARVPRAGGLRVLVLGDDNLLAVESSAEALPDVLEALLNERFSGERFEVIHAGVRGARPQDHAESLRRHLELEPVLCVLAWSSGTMFLDAGRALTATGELARLEPAGERALREAADVNSAAVAQGLHQAYWLRAVPQAGARASALLLQQLASIRDACDARGVQLLLVVWPTQVATQPQLDGETTLAAMARLELTDADLDRTQELVEALLAAARSTGIPAFHPFAAFRASAEPCFRTIDHGVGPHGQRLAARALLDGWSAGFEALASD